jgi:ParB/RepB/Spo0J family partition protein
VTTTVAEPGKELTPAPPASPTTLDNVKQIPLGMIVPSGTNERRLVNVDFVDSIRQDRVLQPILVRPRRAKPEDVARLEKLHKRLALFGPGDDIYEIVAGERRWEGSILAGKQVIPAIVRELTDDQALALQIKENLHRMDLSPVQEANNYRKLRAMGKSVDEIAAMTSKTSKREVFQAMQWLNLAPELLAMLDEGEITRGHASLLCRRTPAQQKLAARQGSGLFDWNGRLISVRELDQWIKNNLNRPLSGAPWKKNDSTLVPKAGACDACQKNTAVNPELDPEAKQATCTDGACFEEKRQAYVVQIEKAEKAAADKKEPVKGTRSVAAAKGRKKEVQRPANPGVTAQSTMKSQVEQKVKNAVFAQLASKAKLDRWTLSVAIPEMLYETERHLLDEFGPKVLGWAKPKDVGGYRHEEVKKYSRTHPQKFTPALFVALVIHLTQMPYDLPAFHKHFKVDAKKLRKQVEAQMKEEERKAAAEKKAAVSKSDKTAAGKKTGAKKTGAKKAVAKKAVAKKAVAKKAVGKKKKAA